MVWGKQGHAPCKTSSSKIPHGSELLWATNSQNVGVGGTCLSQKGRCNPHPGACKHSSQYNGWPGGRLVVRNGMWNLSSLSENGRNRL